MGSEFKRALLKNNLLKLPRAELVAMLLDSDYFRYELEEE